ncbi:MAG: hypothetical protein U0944_01860, partial [Candidatus Moranbacteria bacterium]|nr:hypothetical protein [Candidatus Moranbacteria bacterium]
MDNNLGVKNDTAVKNGDGIAERAASLNIAYLDKAPKAIDGRAIRIIPEEVAKKYGFIVFDAAGDTIKVAMLNPQDIDALNTLRFIAEKEKKEISIYLVSENVFKELFRFYVGPADIVKEAVKSFAEDKGSLEIIENDDESAKEQNLKEAPVAKLVEVIVSHAIEGHASDIHIEPMERDFRVRFRVVGVLHVSLIIPK